MKAHALLFGPGEEKQEVEIKYDYTPTGWFDNIRYEVKQVSILSPLTISPSDVYTDLQFAIASDLKVDVWRVRIDCNYEDEVTNRMLFI